TERVPAAVVAPAGDEPVTIAGDGTVRGPPSKGLPSRPLRGAIASRRVKAPGMLRLLAVSAAAPAGLRAEIESVSQTREHGVVVELGDGVPELRFGDQRRARAKWAAAAVLLADPEVAGGAYIDLRLPERPAVGGLPPTAAPVEPEAEGIAPDGTAPQQAAPEQAAPETMPPQ
ncbi:MAG: cell division protein FtsQ/DivIB, partial [Thermoleophilaceae bacterium]